MRFRSSAAIPRLYRIKFKRDIFKDLTELEKSYKGKTDEGEEMQIEDLEIFENVAYIMAWHADPTIPGTIEEWLDEFEWPPRQYFECVLYADWRGPCAGRKLLHADFCRLTLPWEERVVSQRLFGRRRPH